MNKETRFVDQNNGMVLDNESGLVWAREDSWSIAQDWLTFQEALSFVDDLNKKDYLGFHDWRIAEREEIEKLFVSENMIIGRSKQELHLDPAFAPGGGNGSWCLPFDQQAAFYFNYSSGIAQGFDQTWEISTKSFSWAIEAN